MHHNQSRLIRRPAGWLLAVVVLFGLMSAAAQAQTATRVRGTITAFDGHVLTVKTRDGKDLKVNIPENTSISSLIELQMDDIKQGSFVGVTAIKRGSEGAQYALEVHVFRSLPKDFARADSFVPRFLATMLRCSACIVLRRVDGRSGCSSRIIRCISR